MTFCKCIKCCWRHDRLSNINPEIDCRIIIEEIKNMITNLIKQITPKNEVNFGNLEFMKELPIYVNQSRSVWSIGEIPKYSINDLEITTTANKLKIDSSGPSLRGNTVSDVRLFYIECKNGTISKYKLLYSVCCIFFWQK